MAVDLGQSRHPSGSGRVATDKDPQDRCYSVRPKSNGTIWCDVRPGHGGWHQHTQMLKMGIEVLWWKDPEPVDMEAT